MNSIRPAGNMRGPLWLALTLLLLLTAQGLNAGPFLPLVERFSGRIAVLPAPGSEDLSRSAMGRTMAALGVLPHVVFLTQAELVDAGYFNAERFQMVLYLAAETYVQTVHTTGDGDEALIKYLRSGGTLAVFPSGPFPFYYNQAGQHTGSAAQFGLNIGAGSFDGVPAGRTLTFHLNPAQEVVRHAPAEFGFPLEADQRWRPIRNPRQADVRYTPIVSLRDDRGQDHGDGAALTEFTGGPLEGARLVYVWSSLLANGQVREKTFEEVVGYLLRQRPIPPARLQVIRAARPPELDGRLHDGIWQQTRVRAFTSLEPGKDGSSSVRGCWDQSYLYLGFQVENSGEPDGADRIRLCFFQDAEETYQQRIELGPDNRLRLFGLSGEHPAEPGSGPVRSSVHHSETGWSAELAIPWTWFANSGEAPQIGRSLRAQFALLAMPEGLIRKVWTPATEPARVGFLDLALNPWTDDFDGYAEGSNGAPSWKITGGRWQVQNGTYLGEDCIAEGVEARGVVRGDGTWRDYTLSVRFRVESRSSQRRDGAVIGIRCSREGDGYYLHFTERELQLHKVVYGQATAEANCLFRHPIELGDGWHDLKVEVRANWLAGELNGSRLFAVKDDAHLELPSRRQGGVVLSAHRSANSNGRMAVRFAFFEVLLAHPGKPLASTFGQD